MRHNSKRLNKFLLDRIHPDWIDRLFPQDRMVEIDPYPTDSNNNISAHPLLSTAQSKNEIFIAY